MRGDFGGQSWQSLCEIALLRHLRHGGVKSVFTGSRLESRIIRDHFAAICVAIDILVFRDGSQPVAGRRSALDQVIGHHRVNDVVRPSLGHVATDAIGGRRVPGRRYGLPQRCGVALAADAVVVLGRLRAVRNIVWIVTRSAGERALALQEALRLRRR